MIMTLTVAETPSKRARSSRSRKIARIAFTGAAFALLASPALAQAAGGADATTLLQNIVTYLTGSVARLLAIIAIVVVGIVWMFGLFDLRRAALVVLGIIVVFGAAQIVTTLTGGAAA
jgi:type IV secretion system protein VirB2